MYSNSNITVIAKRMASYNNHHMSMKNNSHIIIYVYYFYYLIYLLVVFFGLGLETMERPISISSLREASDIRLCDGMSDELLTGGRNVRPLIFNAPSMEYEANVPMNGTKSLARSRIFMRAA